MEKRNESCKQCRNKVRPIIMNAAGGAGGGGIERVVALGGALAVASIIAAFSMKKGGKKDSNKDPDNDTTNVAAPAPAPEPATESCAEEDDTSEGMWYTPNELSSTMYQDSCCTNNGTSNAVVTKIKTSGLVSTESSITLEENTIESMEDSEIIQQETLVHDPEEQSDEMTGNHGDIQELSESVGENENNPMNDVHNERLASLEMEFVEIMVVDEAAYVDAEQPTPQPSSPSKEEEKSSISKGEQQQQEYPIVQSSFQPPPPAEEEEEYSSMQSSFPPPPAAAEEEEEYSQMRPTISFGEDRLGEDGKNEDEDEDDLSEESSFSTEGGGGEDSTLQSSFSTEVEEDGNGENAAELDEESSEGTRSSSPEPNMEVIWPAEIMAFISSTPKEINLSHLESEMKAIEDVKPNKGEPHHDSARYRFHGRNNNRETGDPAVMDVRKQHAANRQTWFWLGLVVLVLALLANCLLQSNYLSNNLSFVFPMK